MFKSLIAVIIDPEYIDTLEAIIENLKKQIVIYEKIQASQDKEIQRLKDSHQKITDIREQIIETQEKMIENYKRKINLLGG